LIAFHYKSVSAWVQVHPPGYYQTTLIEEDGEKGVLPMQDVLVDSAKGRGMY
jgi:hypothetical protein